MSCADKYRNHIYENASRNILIPNITSEECRCGMHRQLKGLFFWFPFCMGEGGLVVTPLYSYFFHWSLLLAFSLHLSSSSGFLRYLLTQSSHLPLVEFRCDNDNKIICNHINTFVCVQDPTI